MVVVEARDKDTLTKAVFENVRAGTTIYTDCWAGYRGLELMGLGFDHNTVNHAHNFVNPLDRDVHTNTIERYWRCLRESIPKTITNDWVESYIDKFLFYHHAGCKTTWDKFHAIINLCQIHDPRN